MLVHARHLVQVVAAQHAQVVVYLGMVCGLFLFPLNFKEFYKCLLRGIRSKASQI